MRTEQDIKRLLESIKSQYRNIVFGTTGGGNIGSKISVSLDKPVDGRNYITGKASNNIPPGRCIAVLTDDNVWEIYSGNSPELVRENVAIMRRTRPINREQNIDFIASASGSRRIVFTGIINSTTIRLTEGSYQDENGNSVTSFPTAFSESLNSRLSVAKRNTTLVATSGEWIIVEGVTYRKIVYSRDFGKNWRTTLVNISGNGRWGGAFHPYVVAVSDGFLFNEGWDVYHSSNGVNWTLRYSFSRTNRPGLTGFSSNKANIVLAIGREGSGLGNRSVIWKSSDSGVSWTKVQDVELTSNLDISSAYWTGTKFVAESSITPPVTNSSDWVYIVDSTNGDSWSATRIANSSGEGTYVIDGFVNQDHRYNGFLIGCKDNNVLLYRGRSSYFGAISGELIQYNNTFYTVPGAVSSVIDPVVKKFFVDSNIVTPFIKGRFIINNDIGNNETNDAPIIRFFDPELGWDLTDPNIVITSSNPDAEAIFVQAQSGRRFYSL